jgi:hypothetical protein
MMTEKLIVVEGMMMKLVDMLEDPYKAGIG